MQLKRNKEFIFLLTLTLLLTQFLGMIGTNIVLAEGNQDYSNIVPGKIIVKYKEGVESASEENIEGRFSASAESVNNLGIKKIQLSPEEDVFQVIEELKEDPNVEYAEPVYIRNKLGDLKSILEKKEIVVESVYDPNDYYYTENYQWGIYGARIHSAWQYVGLEDRQNITIAVIDTGVDLDHPDLKGSIVAGYDFVDDDVVPDDIDGHGTHVAGIAAAIADNTEGIAGVAGGAKIMPIRIIGPEGATSEDLADAIVWAADNGADVINLSLGGQQSSFYEYDAIEYAISKGVVIVAAAGNESNHWTDGKIGDIDGITGDERYESPVSYPAAYPGVIGVGAVDWYQDTGFIIADFSNIGPEIDVVAPGVGIFSTYPNGEYAMMSGTSMATPFVSGLAGLILAANDDLSVEQVRDILADTSYDLAYPGFDEYFGYGLIDGEGAFTMPRLHMEIQYDASIDADKGTVNLFTNDHKGTVASEVYGQAVLHSVILETTDSDLTLADGIDGTVVDIVYGEGSIDITFPEVGYYLIYADDNGSKDFVWSTNAYVTVKPEKPVSSLSSGTYTGSKTIQLSTETEGAQIYYTLDGSNPTTSSRLYQGAITINSSTTLKAISYKNGLESAVAVFNYTITNDSGSSGGNTGGGSGSGGSSSGGDDEDKIEAETEEAANNIEIILTAEELNDANENSETLVINTDNVDFEIKPDSIDLQDTDDEIKLIVTELDTEELEEEISKKPVEAKEVSEIFDFELIVSGKKVKNFKTPITVTIKYDKNKVTNKDKLGVYYYNEDKKEWEYMGGKATDNSSITFKTDHFSKYTVMEYNKTFNDISNHWAKYDIEVMAAKHIAKGVSENNFAPDNTITRAEFAALIVRALNIKEGKESGFIDVEKTAWYKDAIDKAYSEGIINGIDEENFNPSGNITREEMASMIMRAYSHARGVELEDIRITSEVKFSDEGSVSEWARNNVRLAKSLGIMGGNPDGTFKPKDNATRAEAIVVIKRLLEKME